MAENTRLKELTVEVSRLKDLSLDVKTLNDAVAATNRDIKRLLETMTHQRSDDNTRFETVETTLDSVLQSIANLQSGSENPSSRPSFQVRNVKLDFPRFDGSDVLQWIFRAEQFFNYYNTSDEQRLTIAAVHMEKDVVPWFQMMSTSNSFPTWVAFTRALEREFGPSPY